MQREVADPPCVVEVVQMMFDILTTSSSRVEALFDTLVRRACSFDAMQRIVKELAASKRAF